MFLPSDIEQIRCDLIDLLNSAAGVDVTIAYTTGGTYDPVGGWSGGTAANMSARALLVCPAGGMVLFQERELRQKQFGQVQKMDYIFVFDTSVALEGKRDIRLTVSGLGTFQHNLEPPQEAANYAVMFLGGIQGVQWMYTEVVK